jgi:hypothetical protein
MNSQVVLPFIPGYFWDGNNIRSTGVCLEPTQHINPENGEIRYYVKPMGWCCAIFVRRQGVVQYVSSLQG